MPAEHRARIRDYDARKRLRAPGCGESDDGYVLLHEKNVQQAVETTPSSMTLYDRDGNKAVDTAPRFAPGLNCIDVPDYRTGELRPCRLADIRDAARPIERLPNIDMPANLGNPGDVNLKNQAMAGVRALLENTRKPLAFIAHDEREAERIWRRLADAAGGWDAMAAKPFGLGLTGPMPLAGAAAQSSVEILARIVVHQIEGLGAPVITGSAIVPMGPRTVNLSYGASERAMPGLAAVEYFESIGVPIWIGGGCTDAHAFDAQAVSEAAMGMLSAAFPRTSFIHNLGYISSGKAGSLEMLVLCDELAGMVRRVPAGAPVDDDALAVDVSLAAGKSGKYLTHPHTIKFNPDHSRMIFSTLSSMQERIKTFMGF